MDSASRFLQALARAKTRATTSGRPIRVRLAREGAEVEMDVSDADRLGLLSTETRAVRKGGSEESDPAALTRQANEMARRVTYLQEPLAVIEMDGRRGRAVLRSASPRTEGSSIRYTEAVFENGRSATVRRYRTERGTRTRRAEPSNLSTETAARLAGDLLDIFAQS
jgi:hypothetical protein